MPNGITTTYEYDGMSRVKRLKHEDSGQTALYDDQYTYNTANQISQIAGLSQTRNFTYDNINRLTGMTDGTNTETYTYDAVGNRTMSGYTTGAFNRLTATSTANYDYDANGSITFTAGRRQTWDRENRLVSVGEAEMKEFRYDALGRRVSSSLRTADPMSLYTPTPTQLTNYTHDGLDVVLDDNSQSGEPNVYYQNAPGIDNKLATSSDGRTKYFVQDHLGSTVGLADSNGSISDANSYDSFGNATNSTFPTRYQFTGREFDTFSGLQYSRARFYDPQIGRFISEDPIGFRGGDINLYGYVGNNPVFFVDPLGLMETPTSLTPADNDKRRKQCAAIKELVRREAAYGTGPASYISSVTFNKSPDQGGTALSDLNNRDSGGVTVDGRDFDIDWFVDSNAVSGVFSSVLGPAAYAVGKGAWSLRNYALNQPQTYYFPYQDSSEVTAVTHLGRPYKDIFDEKWFKEYCPCEK